MKLCRSCQSSRVAPGRRVYCDACGRRASAIWKARFRKHVVAQWHAAGKTGQPPWLDYWESLEARRAYYREYMRKWRERHRLKLKPGDARAADGDGGRVFIKGGH